MPCLCKMAGCSEPVECGEKFCQHCMITECYNEEDRKLEDSQKENI